jgi:hypothetical protein
MGLKQGTRLSRCPLTPGGTAEAEVLPRKEKGPALPRKKLHSNDFARVGLRVRSRPA